MKNINEKTFLIANKPGFFQPRITVIKNPQGVFFKVPEEITNFILRVVGAGGATHWLSQFTVQVANNICNWINPNNCDLENSWVNEELPNYLSAGAFTLALGVYIYNRTASFSQENIHTNIGLQIREVLTKSTNQENYAKNKAGKAESIEGERNKLQNSLLNLNRQINLLRPEEKLEFYFSLQTLNSQLQKAVDFTIQARELLPKESILREYNKELENWISEKNLTSLIESSEAPYDNRILANN